MEYSGIDSELIKHTSFYRSEFMTPDSNTNNSRKRRRRRKSNPRANLRRLQHEEVMNDLPAATAQVDHELVPTCEHEFVETNDQLEDLLQHVRGVGKFTYDTEFIGEVSYWPKLCLIQIGTHERVAVVDAMTDIDLTPIWEAIADEDLEKIVHAGEQDLEPVVRHLDRPAANVFDMQIAAGFTGLPYPLSLTRLMQQTLGTKLGKGLTFTSWDERPISAAHLRYAADDVRYGAAIHHELVTRLESSGRLDWARQACTAACDRRLFEFDPRLAAKRVRGAKSLSAKHRAILIELVAVRDVGARERDLPPRSYLKDESLIDLAKKPPRTREELFEVKRLPITVAEQMGDQIIEAIERGLALPRDQRPEKPIRDELPAERFAVDSLWTYLQTHCFANGVDPTLVATRDEIVRLFRSHRGGNGLELGRLKEGWRHELIGEWLVQTLAGEVNTHFSWSGEVLNSDTNQSADAVN